MHRPAARLRAPDPSAARQSPTTLPPDDLRIVPAPAAGSRRLWRRSIRTVAANLCKRVAMDVASVAKRARTENFPVASLLFPRTLRPHLRAIYGFARLVDILGDEVEGDRLAALSELEREVDACYAGEPTWPGKRASAAVSVARSACSHAAAWPRSRRSSAPTGTSSRSVRARPAPGSRWRHSHGDRRARVRGGRAAHASPCAQLRVRDHGAAARE